MHLSADENFSSFAVWMDVWINGPNNMSDLIPQVLLDGNHSVPAEVVEEPEENVFRVRMAGWQFNWLKFSLEKPLEFWLEFWLEFPLDSTEEKGPF